MREREAVHGETYGVDAKSHGDTSPAKGELDGSQRDVGTRETAAANGPQRLSKV